MIESNRTFMERKHGGGFFFISPCMEMKLKAIANQRTNRHKIEVHIIPDFRLDFQFYF